MIDKVSFSGFKNTGIQVCKLFDDSDKKLKVTVTILNTELTNDIAGTDLDRFTPILEKYPNANNKNFLNFQIWSFHKNRYEPDIDVFVVNDEACVMNMENLGLFEKVAKFLRKVADTPEHNFKVDKEHIKTQEYVNSFFLSDAVDNTADLVEMYKPVNVKKITGDLFEKLSSVVANFLEC